MRNRSQNRGKLRLAHHYSNLVRQGFIADIAQAFDYRVNGLGYIRDSEVSWIERELVEHGLWDPHDEAVLYVGQDRAEFALLQPNSLDFVRLGMKKPKEANVNAIFRSFEELIKSYRRASPTSSVRGISYNRQAGQHFLKSYDPDERLSQ